MPPEVSLRDAARSDDEFEERLRRELRRRDRIAALHYAATLRGRDIRQKFEDGAITFDQRVTELAGAFDWWAAEAEKIDTAMSDKIDSQQDWEWGVRESQPWDDTVADSDVWHGSEAKARYWVTVKRQGPCTLTLIRRRPAVPPGPVELAPASVASR